MRVVLDSGTSIELGDTEATPTIGITDYSRRVTDDYGVTTVVERAFSRRMSVKLALPFDGVSTLQQRLANLRASSALWVADEQIAWLSVRGFYKEFDLDHAVPPLSYCTLTVEGLAETATVADTGIDPAVAGTSTLLLLQPVTIADANLVSSTVPENDAPEWSSQTAYPMGAQVIKAATHRIYESAIAGNVGNDPAGASGLWIDVGPTNRWAIFDQALGTSTTAATSVAVTINASVIQAVALLDVTAANVRVQATGYDRTVAAGAGAITFLDLPAGITRVTVTATGNAVAIGTLLVGKLVGLGTTEASPTAGITDFSRKVVDDFGDVTIVERAWSKRMTAKALIRTDAVDVVANRIATVRAQPSLWIGQTGLDSLIVYGFFKDFSIEVGINVSMLSLSIEGLSKAPPIAPVSPGSVAWPDVTDPTGTKPTDNADVTGDNTSKDTNAVGGKPASDLLKSLDDLERVTIPAVSAAVAQADARITVAAGEAAAAVADANAQIAAANDRVAAAQLKLDGAVTDLANEIARAQGKDEELVQRINSIAAEGGYDDTNVRALIERADTARADGDRALANSIETVVTSYQDLNTATNTRITQTVSALSSADQTLGQRIDSLQSTFVRGITPNGDFGAGSDHWVVSGFDFPFYGQGRLASSTPGAYCSLYGDAIPLLDPDRSFRLHGKVSVYGAAQLTYCGLQVQDAAGGFIANVYIDDFSRVLPAGSYTIDQLYQGVNAALSVPYFGGGGRYPPGAYSVRPLFLANYPDVNGPVAGGYVQITSLWLEDVEAAQRVDAHVSSIASTLADADGALAQRIDSVATDYQGRDAATNTRITDTAIALANATSAVGKRASVLESQASPSGGNLVPNSSLSTLDGWTLTFNAGSLSNLALNGAGTPWMIGGVENNLTLFRGPAGAGLCSEVQSSAFGVRAGSTIQLYALTASHRCRAWVSVFFLNDAGSVGYAGENFGARINAGGQDISALDQTGVMECLVPAGAVRAVIVLRAYDVENDGYAWFSRPFVTEVRAGTESWAPYSAGNDSPVAASTRAFVSSSATTLADADRALAQRIDTVTADYQGRDTNTNARVDGQATALADAKQALGQRIDTVGASIGSAVNAKAQEITTAYTTADQALGSRSATLEAAASSGTSAAKNDRFAYWPDGRRNPVGWDDWTAEGRYTVERVTGAGSPYAVRTTNDANVSSGFFQVVPVTKGLWVIEVTAKCEAGSMTGAGVTLHGQYNLDFVSDPDVNGQARDSVADETRSWAKVVDLSGWTNPTINLHAMQGWLGFGRGVASHYIHWYRVSLRPAGPGDIAGVKNAADLVSVSGRVSNTENVLADLPNRYAAASRTTALEAQVNFAADSGLQRTVNARIEDRATAIADAKAGAVAQTVSDLRAEYNGTSATVSQQAGAIVNLQGKATAYVRLVADAGNGRAALSLWSDQYGGAWSLQGNGLIDGDLTLTGSLNTGKLAPNAVTASAALAAQNAQVNANAEVGSASATIITSSSSAVRIEYKCLASYYASQGGTSGGCYGTVVRIANGVETAVLAVRFGSNTFTNDWAYDFPPEGQVTYVLRFRDYIATGSGGYYWSISQIQLGILGFKR